MAKKNRNNTWWIAGIILIAIALYMMFGTSRDIYVGYWDSEGKHVYCRDTDGSNTNKKGTLQLFDKNKTSLIDPLDDYCIDDKNLVEYICFPENLNEDGTEKNPDIDTNDIFYIEDFRDCINNCDDGKCI